MRRPREKFRTKFASLLKIFEATLAPPACRIRCIIYLTHQPRLRRCSQQIRRYHLNKIDTERQQLTAVLFCSRNLNYRKN